MYDASLKTWGKIPFTEFVWKVFRKVYLLIRYFDIIFHGLGVESTIEGFLSFYYTLSIGQGVWGFIA